MAKKLDVEQRLVRIEKKISKEVIGLRKDQYKRMLKELNDIAKNITESEQRLQKLMNNIQEHEQWLGQNPNEKFEILDAKRDAMLIKTIAELEGQLARFRGLRERMYILTDLIAKAGGAIAEA